MRKSFCPASEQDVPFNTKLETRDEIELAQAVKLSFSASKNLARKVLCVSSDVITGKYLQKNGGSGGWRGCPSNHPEI
jgi:hypothetical protein